MRSAEAGGGRSFVAPILGYCSSAVAADYRVLTATDSRNSLIAGADGSAKSVPVLPAHCSAVAFASGAYRLPPKIVVASVGSDKYGWTALEGHRLPAEGWRLE